jgi:hypothetical protein
MCWPMACICLPDHKKNAAYAQWGEHPISGMARQTVQLRIIKQIDDFNLGCYENGSDLCHVQ